MPFSGTISFFRPASLEADTAGAHRSFSHCVDPLLQLG
jgi:hypothetical protein